MRLLIGVLAATLLAACTDSTGSQPSVIPGIAANAAPDPANQAAASANAASTSSPALDGRTAELVNPDASTMVFLYYDLAGIAPPIDRWVQEDPRVTFAPGHEKAALRTAIEAELEAAAASVRGIGFLRLSMRADLSEYDPAYSEFSVRAFAPSSFVKFDALGQHVSLKFANARTAQIWRVPQEQAQSIRDRIGRYGDVSLDALLKITSVLPAPAGGTIITEVIEYEMRQTQHGLLIGHVQVAQ